MLTVSCPDNYVQRSLKAVVGIQDRTVSIALQNGVHQQRQPVVGIQDRTVSIALQNGVHQWQP